MTDMSREGSLGAPASGDDDGIVGGPRTPQQVTSQKRFQQTQAQVDEVVGIMKTNVENLIERDHKLEKLDEKAEALKEGAFQFEQGASKLSRKYWLQNLKMMIIMGVIGLVIIIIIVIKFMPDKQEPSHAASNHPSPADTGRASVEASDSTAGEAVTKPGAATG